MENSNVNKGNQSNRILGGLILVIGVVFFFRNLGFYVPDWLFSWHVFLIAFGVYLGFKRNFRGGGWLAMVLVGVYFTLQRTILDLDVARYYFPILFTALGLYLIFTPKSKAFRINGGWNKRRRAGQAPSQFKTNEDFNENEAGEDFVDTVNVFSATQRRIFSKKLQGADVVCVFGGCDLNFSQADFEGTIIIDIVAIFGGVKITVPPSWKIRSELTAIFGGLEDKTLLKFEGDNNKTVILKGVAIFGGVEIKNY